MIKDKEEAKKFIEELREKKLSMLEIFDIVKTKSDERLKGLNPKCHLVQEQINEEDLFKKLKDKLEQKKKDTNYPNARTNEERTTHLNIQHLEDSLYKTMKVPLFEVGLAEELNKGADWLIDEILLSTESFGGASLKGVKAADDLFPAEKSYETSTEAKEFIDFIECEKEDYRAFATEFIKKLCDIK